MTQAYPLHWPPGYPRTKAPGKSRFKTSLAGAVANVQDELRRFGSDTKLKVESIVISANVSLAEQRPADPGVAVYFRWDNIDCCIAVDLYHWPEENLQAIALIVEADRAKMRHGGLNIIRSSFRGYAALPPPKGPDGQLAPPWWHVLGFKNEGAVTLEAAEQKYRDSVKTKHPDRGGNAAEFNALTDAIRQARELLKA